MTIVPNPTPGRCLLELRPICQGPGASSWLAQPLPKEIPESRYLRFGGARRTRSLQDEEPSLQCCRWRVSSLLWAFCSSPAKASQLISALPQFQVRSWQASQICGDGMRRTREATRRDWYGCIKNMATSFVSGPTISASAILMLLLSSMLQILSGKRLETHHF